jgi:hypothetical protein
VVLFLFDSTADVYCVHAAVCSAAHAETNAVSIGLVVQGVQQGVHTGSGRGKNSSSCSGAVVPEKLILSIAHLLQGPAFVFAACFK